MYTFWAWFKIQNYQNIIKKNNSVDKAVSENVLSNFPIPAIRLMKRKGQAPTQVT